MRIFTQKTVRFFATLAIAASVFAPVAPVFAAGPVSCGTPGADPSTCIPSGASTLPPAASGNTGTTATNTDLQCGVTSGMGLAICLSDLVYLPTVGLGSWAANITSYVFDYAVQLSLASGAYALDFIAIGWGIVRDVANMSFLFILVYIAFKIMFQAETAGTMRMLVWVVVVALLVNFSFLMTRVVIDAGNIAALQFYNAIAPQGSATIPNPDGTPNPNGTRDITATIMNALNPQGLLGNGGQFKNVVQQPSATYYIIVTSVIYIMTGVTLFMIAAVFIFAAIRFIMRVIGLWFVIIGAPGAFVAAIFSKDKLNKWFSRWLGYLLEFTFYPAVFLFMFYIEVRFMQEMNSAQLFNNLYNATQNSTSWTSIAQAAANVGVRLGFILSTMYLILRASQWMGQAFNNTAVKWADRGTWNLGRGALRLGAGAASLGSGFAFQQTIGRGAAATNNALERRGIGSSFLGYRTRQALQGISRTGVGGARSYNEFKDARGKELKEREKIRERADRREEVQGLYRARERERTARARAEAAGEAGADLGPVVSAPGRPEEAEEAAIISAWERAIAGGRTPTGSRPEEKEADRLAAAWEKSVSDSKPLAVPAMPALAKALEQLDKDKEEHRKANALGDALDTLHGGAPTVAIPKNSTPPAASVPQTSNSSEADEIKNGLKNVEQSLRELAANTKSNNQKAPTVVMTTPAQHIEFRPNPGHESLTHDQISQLAGKVAQKLKPEITKMESALQSHDPEGTPPSAPPAAQHPAPKVSTDVIGPQNGEGKISA